MVKLETMATERKKRGVLFYGCMGLFVLLAVVAITAAITWWWAMRQFNAQPFQPVHLDARERAAFQEKMAAFAADVPVHPGVIAPAAPPEPPRSVTLTERELNALVANNTGLAERVYLDLDNDAIKARVNLPLEPDFPVLGGKTIRATLTLGVTLEAHQLHVRVADLSIGGFPLPNAWLGGLKKVDLIQEYYGNDPAMQAFVEGIEALKVDDEGITLTPAP